MYIQVTEWATPAVCQMAHNVWFQFPIPTTRVIVREGTELGRMPQH